MEHSRFDYLEIGEAAARPAAVAETRPGIRRILKAIEVMGGPGERLGEFNCPWGVAVDGHGCAYVTDSLNHRVQKITPQGDVYGFGGRGADIGRLLNPQGIAVDNQLFAYVVEMGNNRVTKFSPSGEPILTFGSHGNMAGQFDRPAGLVRDTY
ncbi:MAG: NHL repeat-containing protein, partial [Armatimonadota bacterium]